MKLPRAILGWDIGGVNIKAALLECNPEAVPARSSCTPFQMQRDAPDLTATLCRIAEGLDAGCADSHAVTMTAELSQAFRTKREGVAFVLDALAKAFPADSLQVYTVAGRFVGQAEARLIPLEVGASNWAATASFVGRHHPNCILLDIGTTSSDLIPIVNGRPVAEGATDPERLLTGELVYTGALRTPVEAVTSELPLWGETAGISADGFAMIGDAHLWSGRLCTANYSCPTPDGRPATREFAGERLARAVCADREMLDDAAIDAIADALVAAQQQTLIRALRRVRMRWPNITEAVVTGLGDFIAADVARATGLSVACLTKRLPLPAQTAPAAAVAWLLRDSLNLGS
jgi:(4-(4-[2-(gamma-L-glutamylamino)ethyl]phenoxymethyl)furan-2-yl)methanamine synthase